MNNIFFTIIIFAYNLKFYTQGYLDTVLQKKFKNTKPLLDNNCLTFTKKNAKIGKELFYYKKTKPITTEFNTTKKIKETKSHSYPSPIRVLGYKNKWWFLFGSLTHSASLKKVKL